MDEETVLETAEETLSDKRVRFWHRIGVASTGMVLFSVTVILLRFVLVFVLHRNSDAGPFERCLGMAALAFFIIGTFLADLWVLHAFAKRPKLGPVDGSAHRMNPISSLLLTGRLRSVPVKGIDKDILFAQLLLVLFATFISVLLLIVLWTRK